MPSLITLESLGYFISLSFYLVTSFIKYVPYQLALLRTDRWPHASCSQCALSPGRRSEFLGMIALSALLPHSEHHEGKRKKSKALRCSQDKIMSPHLTRNISILVTVIFKEVKQQMVFIQKLILGSAYSFSGSIEACSPKIV